MQILCFLRSTMSLFDDEDLLYEEDKMGMKVTSGTVVLQKGANNLIGISIGGGAPHCPCLFVVQVFDDTPAGKDGTLESGDEIVGVNNKNVKGGNKTDVAHLIQESEGEVMIKYNKLHAEPKQGKTLDIILKKVKHRLVEHISSSTADTLGLSRAILCNDGLVRRLEHLERTEDFYRGLVEHTKNVLKSIYRVAHIQKDFGDTFASIGVREPQPRASDVFTKFGNIHRQLEKNAFDFIVAVRPMLKDLGTYLNKAIPDTKQTIKKYADVKFEYLSYCLKVKEMDDEEVCAAQLHEPLYRVETGNYEYRLVLRCRQDARRRFGKIRADVMVKLELLDQKHVQHCVAQRWCQDGRVLHDFTECDAIYQCVFPTYLQLQKLLAGFEKYYAENVKEFKDMENPEEDDEDEWEENELNVPLGIDVVATVQATNDPFSMPLADPLDTFSGNSQEDGEDAKLLDF
ncbi:unnamed protein product [Darwinula stevensoni]|uniref:PRKCA-binding protein n=1 Tax=Darwinula stevensoni TaxID=69355 RepID=A0A7R8X9A1_9CRUS|nr:unnamed protein product [Darwinula stevensoni]CAG0884172.1 unnamed protein product [Darwinula stevensoni]